MYNSQKRLEAQFKRHKNMVKERSKTWGQKKFSPMAHTAPAPVEETATPWKHVKNDILDDEQEQRSADRFNMESDQAKQFLKQREVNHRRNVIEAKRNEKTTWESFDDGDAAAVTSKSNVRTRHWNRNKQGDGDDAQSNVRKGHWNRDKQNNADAARSNAKTGHWNRNKQDSGDTEKSNARTGHGNRNKPDLHGTKIDPENLTFKQRNFFRRKLTLSALRHQKGGDLDAAIADMKKNKMVRPIPKKSSDS